MTKPEKLLAVAHAEDTYDLLSHIAWTDIIKPKLQKQAQIYSNILVNEADTSAQHRKMKI